MKRNFFYAIVITICSTIGFSSCTKDYDDDNPVPEPEINRFVLFGKTYPAFTVIVSKEMLGEGNYDIYVYPAEDNTIELGLQCSMQHDGMSLDLTKYDPLNAVPDYSGWMWYIYVKKTEEGRSTDT